MATKDYGSIYSIKDFALNTVAPKYFDLDNTNQLNTGMLGYATELIANTTEDTFNAFSVYVREIFPNIAQIPETLYNNAARLGIDNLFATPASMELILFINEKDIISNGEVKNNIINFVLDSQLIVDVESKQFMIDYDINIAAKPHRGDYIYTATYNMAFDNSLSNIKNPYIKTIRTNQGNDKYLGLIVTVRQVNKLVLNESLLNNDKINLPTIPFTFSDQLANFEVFYKAPDSTTYIQLTKKLFNSPPSKEPFCFYKIKDETTIELSFTVRDSYFQPKFGSDIMIFVYTTTGVDGNFPQYNGDGLGVVAQSEVYEYNNNIILFGITRTASSGGTNPMSMEELRSAVIEKFSTTGAYNNENDLQVYFSNYRFLSDSNVLFIKRRDDALERLFTAFSLFKDSNGDIYPTNTLNIQLVESDFDVKYEQTNRFLLKPGHLFRYKGNSADTVEVIPGKTLSDDLSSLTDEFVYTNPFLITVTTKGGIVGFYLNSANDAIALDYSYVNSESSTQFICNTLNVVRNSIIGEDFYTLQMKIMPTSKLDVDLVDDQGVDKGLVKLIAVAEDTTGEEICYFDFKLVAADKTSNVYTYETKINTDDYMTLQEKFQVTNAKDILNGSDVYKLIPIIDCKFNFYAFFKYEDASSNIGHKFDYLPELQPYTLTNIYSSDDNRINFITPINMMRSRIKFFELGTDDYYMSLSFIPFVKALPMKDMTYRSNFIAALYNQYESLNKIVDTITTNFGVDMKFYNTYGKSKSFLIGEDDDTKLDKVNIVLNFKIFPKVGVDETVLIRDLKIFIKDYIESLNSTGYNAIYISNLFTEIENNFSDSVSHTRFVKINNYDSSVQTIVNRGVNIESMTKEERQEYVPEFLTISLNDVVIEISNR